MTPFIHGNYGEPNDLLNETIEAELRYAPPATPPPCPGCEEPMTFEADHWECRNDHCKDTNWYEWQAGALVLVAPWF